VAVPKNGKPICIRFAALLTTAQENESIPKLSSFPPSDEAPYQAVFIFCKDKIIRLKKQSFCAD